jgi:hypothetical protein
MLGISLHDCDVLMCSQRGQKEVSDLQAISKLFLPLLNHHSDTALGVEQKIGAWASGAKHHMNVFD